MKAAALIERATLRMMALALVAVMTAGCGDGPRRNKAHQTYPEYKAAALGLEHDGGDEAIDLSDDGNFGPAAGALPSTSSDAICGAAIPGTGSLKGVVTFAGKTSKRKRFDLSKDAWCAGNHEVLDEGLVVNDAKQIRDVVVFVSKGLNRFKFEPPTQAARLNQQGCMYIPHVLTLMAGQELAVVNSDDTSHNYHFIGSSNDEINKTQPKPTTDMIFSLESPDLKASFRCDIHGWMYAPTYIFSHPYYAVTDESGAFEIKNLPAGEYEISFLHDRKSVTFAAQTVSISAGNATEINVQ